MELKAKALQEANSTHPKHTVYQGVVRYKGRICIGHSHNWRQKLLLALHDTSVGGHSSITATYKKVKQLFYWPLLKQSVHDYIQSCHTCQISKPEHVALPGLLQPLPIPNGAWESIGMDFICGLPKSKGRNVILLIVDRLTKYGHFIPLTHPFNAKTVAQVFVDHIYKLHGLPNSIISDRDPIFTSSFWRELMNRLGVTLNLSSSYHPQTDEQTERLNQCLENYLRCMVFDNPKKWVTWLSLAEYWYNTTPHSATKTSPFHALYGYHPSLLPLGDTPRSTDTTVNSFLKDRHQVLHQLKAHLCEAQARMKMYADSKRSDREFSVGDWVYLRIQPYKQSSIAGLGYNKLSPKYFGPFEVVERIGQVAYRLNLPLNSQIHDVIHVSQLKKKIGSRDVPNSALPRFGPTGMLLVEPEQILDRKLFNRNNAGIPYILVKWLGLPTADATWEPYDEIKLKFPAFILEDENSFMGAMSAPETNTAEHELSNAVNNGSGAIQEEE